MQIRLFLLLFIVSLTAFSQSETDSLLRQCAKVPDDQKADVFLQLSFCTRFDSAKSNAYCRKAYQLALKYEQIPAQAKSIYYFGETHYYSGSYSQAIPYYTKAIPLFFSVSDTFNVVNCYNSIGLCYHYIFQGEKAIARFIEGLKLCKTDREYSAELISNIAMVHTKLNNFDEAISNYRKALEINLEIKDSSSIAVNFNGLGDTYTNMDKPDSALANFLKARHIFKKLKNKRHEAIVIANIASIYPNYPDSLEKSIEYFKQASKLFQEMGQEQYESDIQDGIGMALLKQKKYAEALTALNLSLKLNDKFKRGFALKKSTYKHLTDLYQETGNYKEALKAHILYSQYTDSMQLVEKTQQIANLEKQYETEKKEDAIRQLEARQQVLDIQLQKNRQLKQLGFVTAALLLVFIFFVGIRYIDKAKSNRLLALKNKKIAESERELRLLNAAKNKFFSIIAHDLKNPLHTVMGYSYLLSKDFDKFSDNERRQFATDINQSTNNIFRLLQNLLEWSRSQTGRLVVTPAQTGLNQITGNAIRILHAQAENKNIRIETAFDPELTFYADPQMIETVMRNLISNAIKFTPENGLIEVLARKTDDQVEICVKDSGTGISEEDTKNLFHIDSKVKRKGTNNEDGSGLGLILCKEFVDRNRGKIWVESSLNQGSSFFFTIPARKVNRH